MRNKLEEAFPKISRNSCLEINSESEFWIYDCDEENRCYMKSEESQFQVINNTKNDIFFLAIDKCIFFDDDEFEKCDCAVFNEKTFCFIEIKKSKKSRKKANRKKAKSQLKTTIEIFQGKIQFDLKLEAYLCIGMSPTRPSRSAASNDMILEFEDIDTKLLEGCQKEFIN